MRIKLAVERQTSFGRICRITEWGTYPELIDIQTPAYLTYTRWGHIPNITWDVYEKEMDLKQRQIYQLTLASFFDSLDCMEEVTKEGVAAFTGMPNGSILHLTQHDSLRRIPANYNMNKSMAFWSRSGKRLIDADSFTEILKTCTVHSFVGLSDYDTPPEAKQKRLGKSLFRTHEWNNRLLGLDDCKLNEAPFIPLGGGSSKEQRIAVAKHMIALKYSTSFAVDLWHFSAGEVDNKSEFDAEVVHDLISEALLLLPPECPRLVEGAFNPKQILALVKCGIDLFDSSYAVFLANQGKAFRIADDFIKSGDFKIVDFADKVYREDMDPLFSDCCCHTCKNFQKAYLHHLHNTKELIGMILLTIHNMTEFDRMFDEIKNGLALQE